MHAHSATAAVLTEILIPTILMICALIKDTLMNTCVRRCLTPYNARSHVLVGCFASMHILSTMHHITSCHLKMTYCMHLIVSMCHTCSCSGNPAPYFVLYDDVGGSPPIEVAPVYTHQVMVHVLPEELPLGLSTPCYTALYNNLYKIRLVIGQCVHDQLTILVVEQTLHELVCASAQVYAVCTL